MRWSSKLPRGRDLLNLAAALATVVPIGIGVLVTAALGAVAVARGVQSVVPEPWFAMLAVGVFLVVTGAAAAVLPSWLTRPGSPRPDPRPPRPKEMASEATGSSDWEATEADRYRRYEEARGLFLVHEARVPSAVPGQKADIVLHLAQHRDGPLSQRKVSGVQYTFGHMFTDHSRVTTRAEGGFAISESIYDPLLVLARVRFNDGTPDLLLERYVNFPGDEEAPRSPRQTKRDPSPPPPSPESGGTG